MPTGRIKAPRCNWRDPVIAAADPRFDPSAGDCADRSRLRQACRPILLQAAYIRPLVTPGPGPRRSGALTMIRDRMPAQGKCVRLQEKHLTALL